VKPIGFHRDAEEELEAAIAYYEERREGLGMEFSAAVQDAVARIQQNPQLYGVYKNTDYRLCVLRRFPYLIFYRELDDRVWIAAVAHNKRRPDYWTRRSPA
jgi:toxin ParE1/3/4